MEGDVGDVEEWEVNKEGEGCDAGDDVDGVRSSHLHTSYIELKNIMKHYDELIFDFHITMTTISCKIRYHFRSTYNLFHFFSGPRAA